MTDADSQAVIAHLRHHSTSDWSEYYVRVKDIARDHHGPEALRKYETYVDDAISKLYPGHSLYELSLDESNALRGTILYAVFGMVQQLISPK